MFSSATFERDVLLRFSILCASPWTYKSTVAEWNSALISSCCRGSTDSPSKLHDVGRRHGFQRGPRSFLWQFHPYLMSSLSAAGRYAAPAGRWWRRRWGGGGVNVWDMLGLKWSLMQSVNGGDSGGATAPHLTNDLVVYGDGWPGLAAIVKS